MVQEVPQKQQTAQQAKLNKLRPSCVSAIPLQLAD